jgi:hypothetical protein
MWEEAILLSEGSSTSIWVARAAPLPKTLADQAPPYAHVVCLNNVGSFNVQLFSKGLGILVNGDFNFIETITVPFISLEISKLASTIEFDCSV